MVIVGRRYEYRALGAQRKPNLYFGAQERHLAAKHDGQTGSNSELHLKPSPKPFQKHGSEVSAEQHFGEALIGAPK
jgi:hypothetical protein